MKHVLAAALFVCPIFAAPVTITGTIQRPNGTNATGVARIDLSSPCTNSGGALILSAPLDVTFTSGAFSVALEPTSQCTVTTYYRVRYRVGNVWISNTEYWAVPASPTTTTIAAVRQTAVPPSVLVIANSGSTGASVLKTGPGVTARKIKAGSNITITQNTDDIEIAATGGGGGSGDVVGPSSATADYIVVFDGTTGKLVKMSGCKIVSSVLSCGDGTTQSLIELPELTANGSNKQSIYGAASQSGDGCVVWPVGNPTSGQVLTDSGSSATIDSKTCRVMSWTTPSAGGGGAVCSLGADETITASGDFPTASCSITGLTAGKIIRVKAHGVANNASDVNQGFFRLKLNGTNASTELSSGANGTGCRWTMEFAAEVESAGASAAIDTYGNLAMEATPSGTTVWKQGRQSSTINTTSAVTVRISGIPNGTSPSLTLTHLKVWVE